MRLLRTSRLAWAHFFLFDDQMLRGGLGALPPLWKRYERRVMLSMHSHIDDRFGRQDFMVET